MATCESIIKKDIIPNCADPLNKGIERRGVIMNRSDIDFGAVLFSEVSPNILESLPLKSGKRAFEIVQPGATPFNGVKSTIEPGAYRSTTTHEVPIIILDQGPETAEMVDNIANGEYVIILENKFKGIKATSNPGAAAFQVYGFHQGLYLATGDSDKYSSDTHSGWALTLKETEAPKSAMYLFKTSYSATQTLIDTLKAGGE